MNIRMYITETIINLREKIMCLEEQIPQVSYAEKVELESIITSIQIKIMAYRDILNRLPNENQSLYESQCKYCLFFKFIGGVACCNGVRMDEDLFQIGVTCRNYDFRD